MYQFQQLGIIRFIGSIIADSRSGQIFSWCQVLRRHDSARLGDKNSLRVVADGCRLLYVVIPMIQWYSYSMLLHLVYVVYAADVGILDGEAFLLVTSLLVARSISSWLSLYVSVKLNRSQEGAARASKSSTVAHPEPKVLMGLSRTSRNLISDLDWGGTSGCSVSREPCQSGAVTEKVEAPGGWKTVGWLHHEGQTPHGSTLDRTTMDQSMLDIEEVSRSVSYQAGFAESCQLARTRRAYFAQQPQRGQLRCSSHWFQSISHSRNSCCFPSKYLSIFQSVFGTCSPWCSLPSGRHVILLNVTCLNFEGERQEK